MPKIPKFVIDRLPLKSDAPGSKPSPLQGYSLVGTAPINVEEQAWLIDWNREQIEVVENDNNEQLNQIVEHLTASKQPEVTISIHGYSVPWQDAQNRHEGMYGYIQPSIEENQVFVGYRWQAEKPSGNNPPPYYRQSQAAAVGQKEYQARASSFGDNFGKAIKSLPAFLLGLVIFFTQTLGLSIFLYLFPPTDIDVQGLLVFGLVTLLIYLVVKLIFELKNSNRTIRNKTVEAQGDREINSKRKREHQVYLAVLIVTTLVFILFDLDLIFLAWLFVPYGFTWLILYLTESENTFQFLPLIMATSLGFLTYFYLQFPWHDSLNIGYFAISLIILTIAIAISLLRLLNYFRDRYRATHYGVLDLVAFIRTLDSCLYSKYKLIAIAKVYEQHINYEHCDRILEIVEQLQKPDCRPKLSQQVSPEKETLLDELENLRDPSQDSVVEAYFRENLHRVKLNFIAHSMGCFIATNTVRILSDVFDDLAIVENPNKEIGKRLSFGRLVLVAPDIPVESISQNISNYLASSLRRCEEAYVFSNEADVVLRFASTAANFIGFPAQTRFGGYRLGNVTIKKIADDGKKQYGIVNLNQDLELAEVLELRASEADIKPVIIKGQSNEVAEEFTYFDCTDYVDFKLSTTQVEQVKEESILSFALQKRALSFSLLNDYFWLGLAQFLPPGLIRLLAFCYVPYLIYYHFSSQFYKLIGKPVAKKIRPFDKKFTPRRLNTHGGYFDGEFIRNTICQLAFLGLAKHAANYPSVDNEYRDKQIQVFISQRDRFYL